ncbi:sigma-70 family RNA polymerase sigma factor [Acidisoma cladoniae]|jgi:RNA polymerase sigma factor (sigma-70 family)|uniref:sigma-70 family RNA polymerase sigma factor n=1 Tax=Acidisoma cladoniae TaxID=3040935 RepID=UPI002549E287|nr:sigma-70 family RNA polymerase sigma factor [Acidisoma sp. PAMC 29798]
MSLSVGARSTAPGANAVAFHYATARPAQIVTDDREQRLAALMAAAQRGDATAYQALLRDCVAVIAASARRQGVQPDRVEDVVQEVLLTIHRARATYDPARPFLPWLRAIAQRRAIDSLRRNGRQSSREVHDPIAYEGHAEDGPVPGDALDLASRSEALRASIATLPPGQRQAVERMGLRGESLEEAAAITGRSKGALKVNLHRAIRALRGKLGVEEDEDTKDG